MIKTSHLGESGSSPSSTDVATSALELWVGELMHCCDSRCGLKSEQSRVRPHSIQVEQNGRSRVSVHGCGGNCIDASAWAGPEGGVAARRARPGRGRQT